jgi:hypothetical protein
MITTLMIEVASASETSVIFYQTTRRNNPEDGYLQEWRRLSHDGALRYWLIMKFDSSE